MLEVFLSWIEQLGIIGARKVRRRRVESEREIWCLLTSAPDTLEFLLRLVDAFDRLPGHFLDDVGVLVGSPGQRMVSWNVLA